MSDIGIKELAKHLGISIASVSRALNKPERVSEKMRKKVEKAATEFGYRPNMLGSGLRTAKTNNIIAIIPDLSDAFYSGVITSMETTAAEAGYSVLFGDSRGHRERELRYGSLVQHKQVDGVVFFSPTPPFDDNFLESERSTIPPMVNSCEVVSPEGFIVRGQSVPYVTIDNVLAAEEMVDHLIELGHSRIAAITGGATNTSSQQRILGYRQAHKKAGLTVDEELIYHGEYTIDTGESVTEKILQLTNRPTAIFCMCDEGALGAMHVLQNHGLRIPEDVAVAGFDDIRFANCVTPPLTTVAQPVLDLGKHCIEMLIKLIEGTPIANPHIVLPHRLVIRGSTVSKH